MFNLLKRIYPALVNYPKAEKYALAQDTKICIFQYLNYVSRANNVKSKRMVYAQLRIDKSNLRKDGDDIDILQKRMALV